MPSDASRFFSSLGVKIREASQTAGTFVAEAGKDATGKVADVAERVGSTAGHAVASAATTTGTFIREGIPETIGKVVVAVGKTKGEKVQDKDCPYIKNVAEQPGLEDSHTYIKEIQQKIVTDVRALPDDPKTEPNIYDDSEKLPFPQTPDYIPINIGDTEDIGREGGSSLKVTEDIGREGGSNRKVTEDIGREGGSSRKVWIFLIANLGVEILSAAFEQLSSVRKPECAIVAMLMAYVGLLGCIAELAFRAGKERVSWRWDGVIPWFYISTTTMYRPFGTFSEIFGLVCAILQSISSMVAHALYSKGADNPINGSFSSVVFAFGLLCSQFLKDRSRNMARADHED